MQQTYGTWIVDIEKRVCNYATTSLGLLDSLENKWFVLKIENPEDSGVYTWNEE